MARSQYFTIDFIYLIRYSTFVLLLLPFIRYLNIWISFFENSKLVLSDAPLSSVTSLFMNVPIKFTD